MAELETNETRGNRGRQIWSGTVSFGLVSIPVSLVPGTRGVGVTLRMLSKADSPLSRRYACSKEGTLLTPDEIVRGFEVSPGRFVSVSDQELEAVAPEKSRDIDLRRFVPINDIDPVYYDHPYYLAPGGGSTKAYRLLAQTMADLELAGIATFVMRDKEYLVAILSDRGVLCALTLRFADEVRSAADVGLPSRGKVDTTKVKRIRGALSKRQESRMDFAALVDQREQSLMELIASKSEEDRDIVRAHAALEPGEQPVIDLMEQLKRSLAARSPRRKPTSRHTRRNRKAA